MPFNPSKLKAAGNSATWGEPPPPGLYTADLADGGAFTSRAEQDWAKLTFSIASGHLQGHQWDALYPLDEDAPRLHETAMNLKAIGVNLDAVGDLAELEDAIRQRTGRRYEVEISQNGRFVNTDVKAEDTQLDIPIDTSDLPDPDAAPHAAVSDDEIPF